MPTVMPVMPKTIIETLPDEAATSAIGAAFAPFLVAPMVIFLHGDLGAGKTTLVRGLLRALGFSGRVKSPTYALLEVYAVSRLNLYHFDFYRLSDPDEWHEAGFRDTMNTEAICLIEWPEKAHGAGVSLPIADVEITLTPTPDNQRQCQLTSNTPAGAKLLDQANISSLS
jgi:tRNA threonylcarbamoyladenosine biosynthesis protein TsaE